MFSAISLPLLLAIAGFAVDFGNWYLNIQKAQRAADAAALDGAVYMPDNLTMARTVARQALVKNGVPGYLASSAEVRPDPKKPTRLYVKVQTDVENKFIPLVGAPEVNRFERAASAVWQPPLGAGNYSNVLGYEPGTSDWQPLAKKSNANGFWVGIQGARTWKIGGQKYYATNCRPDYPDTYWDWRITAGCNGPANAEQIRNSDGSPRGHNFAIEVPPGASGNQVAVEVYDPAFVATGNDCDIDEVYDLYYRTKDQRHKPENNEFCTGDYSLQGDAAERFPTTTFSITDRRTGTAIGSCPVSSTFRPYGTPYEGPRDELQWYANNSTFRSVFHQWFRLCTIPYDPARGLRAQLNVKTDTNSEGGNYFSIRAGMMTSGTVLPQAAQVAPRVFGIDHYFVRLNQTSSNMKLPISFVPPAYAGETVEVSAYNLGLSKGRGTAALTSEASSKSQGATTKLCTVQRPGASGTQSLTNCKMSMNNQDFTGQTVKFFWRVPDDYTCDPTGGTAGLSCHLFMRIENLGDDYVDEVATFEVQGVSGPPRLLPDP